MASEVQGPKDNLFSCRLCVTKAPSSISFVDLQMKDRSAGEVSAVESY